MFICIRCAGIHRNLGVHISRVKSVNLDQWTSDQMQVFSAGFLTLYAGLIVCYFHGKNFCPLIKNRQNELAQLKKITLIVLKGQEISIGIWQDNYSHAVVAKNVEYKSWKLYRAETMSLNTIYSFPFFITFELWHCLMSLVQQGLYDWQNNLYFIYLYIYLLYIYISFSLAFLTLKLCVWNY